MRAFGERKRVGDRRQKRGEGRGRDKRDVEGGGDLVDFLKSGGMGKERVWFCPVLPL